jgi:hypothetical protein
MVGDAADSVIRERPQGAEALPHFEFATGFPQPASMLERMPGRRARNTI